MDSQTTDELIEYIKSLSDNIATRESFDKYSRALKTCSAEEVNFAIDWYIETETDFEKIEKIVARFIRACGNGLESGGMAAAGVEPVFISVLREENRRLERLRKETTGTYRKLADAINGNPTETTDEALHELAGHMAILTEIVPHYQKIRNSLFAVLEKYAEHMNCLKLMWHIQDKITANLKRLRTILDSEPFNFKEFNRGYGQMFLNMGALIYREERILFPIALSAVPWRAFTEINSDIDEYGTAFGVDKNDFLGEEKMSEDLNNNNPGNLQSGESGSVRLSAGELTANQIDLMLMNLPVDITFVDEHDKVRYFSQGRERIFPRSPGIIGRSVQNCHPPKSVHIVQKIVDDFKARRRDSAEFWIQMDGKFIHIRYFPLFDGDNYKGVIEVSQELNHLRSLEGEKRLLDEE